jgi:predicted metal-dependent hydrolase
MRTSYDPRYLQGIEYFNDREFFSAHEAWEELWIEVQDNSRRFYQGLIQVAVCLHHFGTGNTRGARKLFHSSRRYLTPYRPRYEGIDVDRLVADMERCCAEIDSDEAAATAVTLDPDKLPQIVLDPPTAA